jgi:preprotein translocase subunit YajC
MQDLFGSTSILFPIIIMFGVMYFLVMRPQQQRVKQLRQAIENVRRGDTVVTAGGIVGRVAKVPQKDDPELSIEIADGVTIKVLRSTLSEVRPKNQPANDKE